MPHTGASTPLRITVVRPGALGDTLLALSALASLRRWAPAARLTLIARGDCLPLALTSGLADAAWSWDLPDWGILFAEGSDEGSVEPTPLARAALAEADLVVVWLADPTGQIARRLAALGARQALVASPQPPPDDQRTHVALWLARTLRPLGLPDRSLAELVALTPRLTAPPTDTGLAGPRTLALHPGAGSAGKRWPAERFAAVAALARAAGYAPLLLAGPADDVALAETQSALRERGVAATVERDQPLTRLAELLSQCAGYLGNDSGVSHLAALVGAPTVAVFGPTDPARWSPLGPRVRTLRAPDARLASIDAGEAWQALRALIDG